MRISALSKKIIKEVVEEVLREKIPLERLDLLERIVRLEEGQKTIIKIMNERFKGADRRFEAVDKKFEGMNPKFTMLTTLMGIAFSALAALILILKFLSP